MTPTDPSTRFDPIRVGGRKGWDQHPGVRTGVRLRPGERAADRLFGVAGSWPFLIMITGVVVAGAAVALLPGRDAGTRALLAAGLSAVALVEVSLVLLGVRRAERIAVELALYHLDHARRAAAVAEDLREQIGQLHADIARIAAVAERAGHAPRRS